MRLYSYLLFDYYFQQLHMNKVLHADTQLSTRINDCWSTYSFCRGWSDTIVYLQMKAAKMWTHWSQPFCCRPQGETLGVLDTLFWNTSERTQQQTLYLSPMVSYKKKGSGHSFALHPLGANTCGFSTCLVMSSVVQLLSDFVFTPYVLRQRHQSNSPTCDLCDTERWCPRWAACSFPLRQSPRDFSPQEICFPQQESTTCLLS